MNISTEAFTSSQLSQRLRTETSTEHERMHQLMAKADVFANQQQYAKFTLAQYYFQQDIEYLFKFPELANLVPDIEVRGRSQAALMDLQDLGLEPQQDDIATVNVGLPQALGWLYVSEGSTLGAAFLFKEAQKSLGLSAEFGARNLAAYPEGRAKVWKRFVQSLDDANFSKAQQDQVIEGAMAGFARFGELLQGFDQLK